MITPIDNKKRVGDCEVCGLVYTQLTMEHGNIWMCSTCKTRELEMTARSRELDGKSAGVNDLVERSRQIDQTIQIKTDIFVAKTVAAMELYASIQQSDEIPQDKKEETFTRECMTRFEHLQKVVFEQRQALLENENELRMWQTNGQHSAGKLRADIRAEFKAFDVSYQPIVPKTVKPKSDVGTKISKKQQMEEIHKFAVKYEVPESALAMLVQARKMSPESAAKHLVQSIAQSVHSDKQE